MPRHTRVPAVPTGETASLVRELASELKDPRPMGQPIILEDSLLGGDALSVQVVWDRWQGISDEIRAEVIHDAYSDALGEEYRQKIRLSLGVTVPEAANLGLLPFQVIPARRKGEEPSHEEYRKAMSDAGASLLLGEGRPQLRFATLEDAEVAMESLQEVLPSSRWIIAQEVSSSSVE